jgi:hypothetical protein
MCRFGDGRWVSVTARQKQVLCPSITTRAPDAYRIRLADRARTLPDLVPEDSGLPDAHSATVAATWPLSIEHADRLRPTGLARTTRRQPPTRADGSAAPAFSLRSSRARPFQHGDVFVTKDGAETDSGCHRYAGNSDGTCWPTPVCAAGLTPAASGSPG